MRFRRQQVERNGHGVGISIAAVDDRVHGLLRLDQRVPVERVGGPERGERLARIPFRHAGIEHVQRFDDPPRLRRRPRAHHGEPIVIRGGRRRDPLAFVVREIVERHRAAERVRLRHEGARHFAFVEDVAPLRLDQPERLRQIRVPEDRSRRRACAVDVEGLDGIRIHVLAATRERKRILHAPAAGDFFADRKSLLRIVDGRLQHLFECFRSEPREHFLPAPERSRHGDGENAS